MSDDNQPTVVPAAMGILQYYTLGFLVEGRDHNGAAQLAAGSGVLIDLHGLKGILTAGHVAKRLEQAKGNLGLFSVAGPESLRVEQLRFPSSAIRCVRVGGDSETPSGPDLGFVRLPQQIEARLTNRHSFYNIRRRCETAASATTPLIADVIMGAVGEKVRLKSRTPTVRIDERTMDLATGKVVAERPGVDGFDTFDFEVGHDENVRRPRSYEGMSGSAVWRIGETSDINDRLVLGIAFYQSEPREDGRRLITCHGASGIYGPFSLAIEAAKARGELS